MSLSGSGGKGEGEKERLGHVAYIGALFGRGRGRGQPVSARRISSTVDRLPFADSDKAMFLMARGGEAKSGSYVTGGRGM